MKLKRTRIGRILEALNPFKVARFARDIWSNGRRASKESGVSLLRIGAEQVALYVQNRLSRQEYYMYSLHDPGLSWEEKKAFISRRGSPRYRQILTPKHYGYLLKNKLIFARYGQGAGLPLAELYGVFDPGVGRTADGAPLCCAEDLWTWLRASDICSLVVKPVESRKGNMVMPLTWDGEGFFSARGRHYTCEELVDLMTDARGLREAYEGTPYPPRTFLLEERLRPHPELRYFTQKTLCSARVVTLRNCEGNVEILGALFKLPGVDSGVDNLSQGGLCVGVELGTGKLMEGVFYQSVPPTRYRSHPTTGKDFYGFVLPMWDEVRALAVRAALAFPMARAVGWDVAMADRGVVLIEGNEGWGVQGLQQVYHEGLLKGRLKATWQALSDTVT